MSYRARLGLFLFGALVLLLAGVFIIGEHQQMFTRNYHLRAEFPNVAGLLNGAEVRLGGLRKGLVEEIDLPSNPQGKVVVTFSIDRSTSRLVKTDSQAAIETEGLLGNKFLSISFGSPGAADIQDGATVATAPLLDASDLIKKTDEILDLTKSTMKNLNAAVANLASMTAGIDHGQGTVGALLHERSLYDHLNATADQAQKTMVLAKAGVMDFQDNMKALKGNFLLRGFFKERGYLEASELTRWEVATLPAAQPLKSFLFPAQDLFAKADSAQLKARKRLNEVGAFLEKTPFDLVVVQAFTGPKGDHDANRVLTQAQAMVVRTCLVERFELDDTKVKTMGMGEVATNVPGREHWLEIVIY